MPPTDVVFTLTGDVRRNSRAIRQLRLLRSFGLTVTVLALGHDTGTPFLDGGVYLRYLPRPTGGGPRFFWKVHRLFLEAARRQKARVFHASDLYCLRAMRLAATKYEAALVYDARELYPHVASTAGRPWVRAFWRRVERRDIGAADTVFTVSDSIAVQLQTTYGIARPNVLHNVPESQCPRPSGTLRQRAGIDSNSVLILHQGSIQKSRGCFLLLDAMRDVDGAVLVFMGSGPQMPALARAVREHGIHKRVRLVDPMPPDALLPVTADADLGVTLLEDTCLNHQYALPNKLFEYLMAGVPVLASDLHEMRRVVEHHQVGMVVRPSDRRSLVQALQQCANNVELRRKWRANTPRVFETYNWSVASQRFTTAYHALLQK